jgi:catechol 2,3-dioxygenase-like lactoylglutathione lyase family enzyme
MRIVEFEVTAVIGETLKIKILILASALILISCSWAEAQTDRRADPLPPPGFHHLHLNSVNPDAAIDFYTRQFPSTTKATVAGFPTLKTGKVYLLFTKVPTPPPIEPQTAVWHFGWHVTNARKNLELYKQRKEVHLLPLYTTEEGGFVFISSDTWPGTGGVLGLTKSQIAEAKAKGVEPLGGPGFAYLQGPDRAIIEYQGDMPVERFNHVHMYQEDPDCAQLWYQKHLNAAPSQPATAQSQHTETDCKVERSEPSWPGLEKQGTIRKPSAGVLFDDVALNWYSRQGDKPLVSTRGHLADHIGLSVTNLDAWVAKLRKEGVKFLEEPYKFGDTRAVMIEGPSREALELVEVK